MARSVIYGTGLNECPEEQRRFWTVVNGSDRLSGHSPRRFAIRSSASWLKKIQHELFRVESLLCQIKLKFCLATVPWCMDVQTRVCFFQAGIEQQ